MLNLKLNEVSLRDEVEIQMIPNGKIFKGKVIDKMDGVIPTIMVSVFEDDYPQSSLGIRWVPLTEVISHTKKEDMYERKPS